MKHDRSIVAACAALLALSVSGCPKDRQPERGATPEVYCDRITALSALAIPEETQRQMRARCVLDATDERRDEPDLYVCKSRCAHASRDMTTYTDCIAGCEIKRKPAAP